MSQREKADNRCKHLGVYTVQSVIAVQSRKRRYRYCSGARSSGLDVGPDEPRDAEYPEFVLTGVEVAEPWRVEFG